MDILEKYSLFNMCKAYNENKVIVDAYLQGKSIEGYNDDTKKAEKILGMGVAFFALLFLLSIAFWVWAVVILIKNWKVMPDWAKALGVLFLTPLVPFPLGTLLLAYLVKK